MLILNTIKIIYIQKAEPRRHSFQNKTFYNNKLKSSNFSEFPILYVPGSLLNTVFGQLFWQLGCAFAVS